MQNTCTLIGIGFRIYAVWIKNFLHGIFRCTMRLTMLCPKEECAQQLRIAEIVFMQFHPHFMGTISFLVSFTFQRRLDFLFLINLFHLECGRDFSSKSTPIKLSSNRTSFESSCLLVCIAYFFLNCS